MSTIRPVVAALLIAGPVAAQETTNNPFPDPIPASEGMIVVGLEEFATLPDIDGAAARPMVLVDEPSSERLFVNDMWGLLYGISDELHQSTVEGRIASASDVLLDVVGIMLTLTVVIALIALLNRRKVE